MCNCKLENNVRVKNQNNYTTIISNSFECIQLRNASILKPWPIFILNTANNSITDAV